MVLVMSLTLEGVSDMHEEDCTVCVVSTSAVCLLHLGWFGLWFKIILLLVVIVVVCLLSGKCWCVE